MKIGFILILSLILLPFVSANDIDFKFDKDYSSGETAWMQVDVNVNLSKDLTTDNFVLMKDSEISSTKALVKVNDKTYFFYFEIPKLSDGDYKLVLKNISYTKNNMINKNSFETGIKIVNINQTIYLWPAVMFSEFQEADKPMFKVLVKNVGWNKVRIMVSSSDENLVNSIAPVDFNLVGQSTSWVNVRTNITDYSTGFQTAMIHIDTDANGHYIYPLILKKRWYSGSFGSDNNTINETVEINTTIINETKPYVYTNDSLRFINPASRLVNQTIKFNSQKIGVDWTIKNFAEQELHNLNYSLTGGLDEIIRVRLDTNDSSLNASAEMNINVAVYPNQSTKNEYIGKLIITSLEGVQDSVDFELKFVNETTKMTEKQDSSVLIAANKSVNVTPVKLGETKETNNTAWIIVLIVIAVIGIIALVFYKKSKPKKENFEEYLKALER